MQLPQLESSIFTVDYEITLSVRIISYLLLEDFLAKLDLLLEPHRGWTTKFLTPLRRMGVRTLDDMELVTPEGLYVFFSAPTDCHYGFFCMCTILSSVSIVVTPGMSSMWWWPLLSSAQTK